MKLFILGFYLVLVLAYLDRTSGQGKAANSLGKFTRHLTRRSRPMKTTATKSSTFSHVSLPNKSYNRKPRISKPRLDIVQFDPKKLSKPGQIRKPFKQTNRMTTENKPKVANVKASISFENKKSSITNTKKQNNNLKLPALKTTKITPDIKSDLKKYLRNNKSNKPAPILKNAKTNSYSTIASYLRSFSTKQKGVNTGTSNKPRKLPRRICSGSDCVLPELNDDKKTPTSPLKTEAARKKYLTDKKIKFNEKGLIGTVEKHGDDSGPDVIFLEKGNIKAGLTHILEDDLEVKRKGHREDFKSSFGLQGSNNEEIDSQIKQIILKAAASKSVEKTEIRTKIDDDGKKKPPQMKMVKEGEWNGKTKRMNLAIGSNGFIVSAFPASSKKDAPDTDTKPRISGNMLKKKALQKAKKEAQTVIPEPNTGAGAA